MTAQLVLPPEVGELITLKADQVTRGIEFDQTGLRNTLRKYRDYIRDLNSRSVKDVLSEIDTQVVCAKNDLTIAFSEEHASLESSMMTKLNSLMDHVTTGEATIEALSIRLEKQILELKQMAQAAAPAQQGSPKENVSEKALEGAPARQGSPEENISEKVAGLNHPPSQSSSAAVSVSSDRVGISSERRTNMLDPDVRTEIPAVLHREVEPDIDPPASARQSQRQFVQTARRQSAHESLPAMDASHSPRKFSAQQLQQIMDQLAEHQPFHALQQPPNRAHANAIEKRAAELRRKDSSGDLSGSSEDPNKIRDDLQQLAARVGLVEGKLEGTTVGIEARLKKHDEGIALMNQSVDNFSTGADTERKRVDILISQIASTRTELERLDEQKVDGAKFDSVAGELDHLRTRVNLAAVASTVEERLGKADRGVLTLGSTLQRLEAETQAIRQQSDQVQTEFRSSVQAGQEAERRLDRLRQEHFGIIDSRVREATDRVQSMEESLAKLQCITQDVARKANYDDLVQLRTAISAIAEDVKDSEQAVLFGARCLSCNRVFDDVQQESGVVDLPGERQRQQLFAEVQRALRNPRADPLKPIKMLAVRVGRPSNGGIANGGREGGYNVRDSANIACGVEDLLLVPARTANSVTNMGDSGSVPIPSPSRPCDATRTLLPPTSHQADAPMHRRLKRSVGKQEVEAKDGPHDFRYPISHLVGRKGAN